MNFAPIALLLVATAGDDPPVSFAKDVALILARNCLACHGSLRAESGLSMATLAQLRKGGKRVQEETIVAGDPDGSFLVEVIRPDGELRMPLKLPPLPAEQVGVIERWVKQGAKFDGGDETAVTLATLVDPLEDLPAVAPTTPAADPIAALAYAPDGTLAVGRGESIALFDGAGKATGTIEGLAGKVAAVRFTPDGALLVVASGRPGQFGAVSVWKVEDRSKVAEVRGHADMILDADLSPDGSAFATGSYDRMVKLWEVPSLKERHVLREHTDSVHAVAFSPDGKLVASAGADRTAKVWDAATGKKRHSLSESTGELFAVVFGPDGRTVMAAGADRAIRAWDVSGEAPMLLRTALAHQAPVIRLAVMPDGSALFSSGEDRTVKSWDWRTLEPRSALPPQADWVQSIAVRPGRLALGRYDGSLEVADPTTGKSLMNPLAAPTAEAKGKAPEEVPKPQLARRASLGPPAPRSGLRGQTVRVRLGGNGVGKASDVVTYEPGLSTRILPDEKPNPDALQVELAIAPDARVGVHRLEVLTPLGVAPAQPFLVHADPEAAEVSGKVAEAPFPSVLAGTIAAAGEEDRFRFAAKEGQPIVVGMEARSLGSTLAAVLRLRRESGEVLATASARNNPGDPTLIYMPERDEVLVIGISDADRGASGNHFYRAFLGTRPYATGAFPRGIEAGTVGTVAVEGVALAQSQVPVDAKQATPGDLRGVAPGQLVVIAAGPQAAEAEPNESPEQAAAIASPGGISGRIGGPGDVDLVRFPARKGEKVVLEVYGRRLASTIDPILEILDREGKPVPRAVLRPVAETNIALRDHGSVQPNVRLTQWSDLAVGDYLLAGREVIRIRAMPRNPDDDAVMYSSGGQRIAWFDTTPEHHPFAQVLRKVEVHPPGTTFPAGGVDPVILDYRNDDGGDGYGKDARITFDPPADGDYYARVADARGFGGPGLEYHLVLRAPRPDFVASLSPANPAIPRGGAAVINIGLRRIDGFDGPVDIALEGLPPGITATPCRVEPGQSSAEILLMADATAAGTPARGWKAKAVGSAGPSGLIAHEIDPGGPLSGWITAIDDPDLAVTAAASELAIRPGQTVELSFGVRRGPAFQGRVPIDVKNLPFGVRVLNIGLNGVLVTEKQTERTVAIYAEPWAIPQERPFFAVGRVEANGTEHPAPPILLKVAPASGTPAVTEASKP